MSARPARPARRLEELFPDNSLPKDVRFDENRRCEDCGAQGAYDLHGAHLCAACVEDALRGMKSPGQSRT